jgi:hypothetical protein
MTQMPDFIPGLELGRRLYYEQVRPLLDAHFAGVDHAAAVLGSGSEVLGYDTAMSTDHDWGPTVTLFLRESDAQHSQPVREMLSYHLSATFYGYPIHQQQYADDAPTSSMVTKTEPPFNHRVFVTTVREFCQRHLGIDPEAAMDAADWLTIPSQRFLSVTAGAVYHDGVGELTALREKLAFYTRDVWLYLMAAGWQRISQEEHLMPRAGYVGDELGSAVIGGRLVQDVMRLCFLIERRYAPYPKWFGTAFSRLNCASTLTPILRRAQTAITWQERETALCEAYERLAQMHNALGFTEPLDAHCVSFFDRPFRVLYAERFAAALLSLITDPAVKRIATKQLIGGIDQISDSTDLKAAPAWRTALKRLYD